MLTVMIANVLETLYVERPTVATVGTMTMTVLQTVLTQTVHRIRLWWYLRRRLCERWTMMAMVSLTVLIPIASLIQCVNLSPTVAMA